MNSTSTPDPTPVAEAFDAVRSAAKELSDAIKAAKARGVSVSVQMAPEGAEHLIQLIYSV